MNKASKHQNKLQYNNELLVELNNDDDNAIDNQVTASNRKKILTKIAKCNKIYEDIIFLK